MQLDTWKRINFQLETWAPKVQAVVNFLQIVGKRVIITSIDKTKDALKGEAGTHLYIDENG